MANSFLVLGTGLLAFAGKSIDIYAYEVLLGFGVGGILVLNSVVVKLNARAEDAGEDDLSVSVFMSGTTWLTPVFSICSRCHRKLLFMITSLFLAATDCGLLHSRKSGFWAVT